MKHQHVDPDDPRIVAAVQELQALIQHHYPSASFAVTEGEDPEGIYLTATVDIDDTEEVVDLIIDRMLEMQIEEGLPVYVIPVRPIERVIAEQRERQRNPKLPTALLP
jgi:hypothetical protein